MQNKVATLAATADPNFGRQGASPSFEGGTNSGPAAPTTDQADLRLIIEEDEASGTYVYKTINRVTGEVVLQLPRDDILRLREAPDYVAGVVIRTKA
jgi:flagellar protein FlaG